MPPPTDSHKDDAYGDWQGRRAYGCDTMRHNVGESTCNGGPRELHENSFRAPPCLPRQGVGNTIVHGLLLHLRAFLKKTQIVFFCFLLFSLSLLPPFSFLPSSLFPSSFFSIFSFLFFALLFFYCGADVWLALTQVVFVDFILFWGWIRAMLLCCHMICWPIQRCRPTRC